MNKQSKRIFAGFVIVMAVLFYPKLSAFAASLNKTIEVAYRDIKIYVSGDLVTPTDASGKIVEPFIYDGTTYLPVRAISEALGQPVEWDGKTNSVYIGESIPAEITEVTVSTAEELIGALGSNKRILLEEGVYNLTSVSASHVNNSSIYFDNAYDGRELRLDGIHNLTIQGIGDAPSEIVIEPRYAYVMNFSDCSNISISGIKAGHTEGGYCTGGVFSFTNSSGIQIDNTHMYGCGTIGLNLDGVTDMKVTDSSIYECTYGIMTISKSKGITFENCVFRDNGGYTMVSVLLSSDITIESCEFLRNESQTLNPMFSVSQSDNVEVKNSTFKDNKADKLIEPASGIIDASNTFENNTF